MSKKEMKTKQDFMDLLHARKGSSVKPLADDTQISFTVGEFRETVNDAQVKRGLTINLLKMTKLTDWFIILEQFLETSINNNILSLIKRWTTM